MMRKRRTQVKSRKQEKRKDKMQESCTSSVIIEPTKLANKETRSENQVVGY